ncbi:MAG: TlpA family protein disulfide reductase [Oscillospiraceae bacterium]|nr:TlpA family protein disulfide reductase [Oscillospiraceae bacterium]
MINLVIFSASWCNPCHEQIPALKEIYQKLKGKINMMYISLDKSETVNNWKALMEEEQIPWRILLATNDVEAIQKKYYAKSIPRIYIIYPDKHFELLDVSEKADIDKLYYLANSYSF